jgi:hypothetical protein
VSLQGFFQAEKTELQLAEPFSVRLFLRNETDRDLYVLVPTGRADGIQISVKVGANVQVKDMMAEPEPGVVAEVKLSPGDSTSRQFPLSDWLIIKEPGSCTLECAVEIEAREASGQAKAEDHLTSIVAISTELNFTFRPNKTTEPEQ